MKSIMLIAAMALGISALAQKERIVIGKDTLQVDTVRFGWIRANNRIYDIHHLADTTKMYIFTKIDTLKTPSEIIVEDNKGRLTKKVGFYIVVQQMYTIDGRTTFPLGPQVPLGAVDDRKKAMKPYIPRQSNQ